MEPRRVKTNGEICYENQLVFISSSLSGWSVGLESCGERKYNVHFAQLLLGQLDQATVSFQRIQPSCQEKQPS
jgi:hypothetical protein